MEKKFNIAGLGETLWDIYENQKYPGGAPANFAFHVSQAGQNSYLLTRIGNDKDGKELLKFFKTRKIDTTGIQTDKYKPTGSINVKLDNNGIPSFQCSEDVAFDYLEYNHAWENIANNLDAVLFGTLAQRSYISHIAIQSFLKNSVNLIKIFDINLRDWNDKVIHIIIESLALSDIIKMNEKELKLLKEIYDSHDDDLAFLRSLMFEYKIKLGAVTLNEKGCYCLNSSDYSYHPGFNINSVDTTGCGDAFAAGLIIKYLNNASLKEIAEYSNRIGAFVSTKYGAMPDWIDTDINEL